MSAEPVRVALLHGPVEREYTLLTPSGAAPGAGWPLVVVFHGGGSSAAYTIAGGRWREFVEEAGVAVVFPEALRKDRARPASFLRNPQFWNAGSGHGWVARAGVDDVGFTGVLLADVAGRVAIDARRQYACGFSNGAAMTFRAALELRGRFAAIAALAGHCWLDVPADLPPTPLLFIAGDADPINPLAGGRVTTPWGLELELPALRETVAQWAVAQGCDVDAVQRTEQGDVSVTRYGPGRGGAEVHLYVVRGLGHTWPGGREIINPKIVGRSSDALDGTRLVGQFFSRWRR